MRIGVQQISGGACAFRQQRHMPSGMRSRENDHLMGLPLSEGVTTAGLGLNEVIDRFMDVPLPGVGWPDRCL